MQILERLKAHKWSRLGKRGVLRTRKDPYLTVIDAQASGFNGLLDGAYGNRPRNKVLRRKIG